MEVFAGIIGAAIGLALAIPYLKKYIQRRQNIDSAVDHIEDDSLHVSPDMKQSLCRFSVENAAQLRQMNADELVDLLSCSVKILTIFERRIEKISFAYEQIDSHIDSLPKGIFSAGATQRTYESNYAPYKERLNKQIEQTMRVFDEDLLSVGSVLRAIPERYRMSLILHKMCEYLTEGEVDSWEGCIKTFKEDIHRIRQNQHFMNFQTSLDRIDRNTSAAALFAGIAARNTF